METLDNIDLQLLRILQKDSKLTVKKLLKWLIYLHLQFLRELKD